MQVPVELLWGVDVAIKKLRPGASFGLSNSTFTNWHDPNGLPPPSWEEVLSQMEADKKAYNDYMGIVEKANVVEEPVEYIPTEEHIEFLVNEGKELEKDVVETPFSIQRINICQECDNYSAVKICKKCWCFMPWKTKLEGSKCPLDKW